MKRDQAAIGESEPVWLDEDERSLWLSLTCVVMKLPTALDAQLQKRAELTFFEYLLLAMLSEQPSCTLKMSELASITNASLSRLSHVARRLESRGLLTRSEDAEDRRCTNATVTKAGLSLVEAAAPEHVVEDRQAADPQEPLGLHEDRGVLGLVAVDEHDVVGGVGQAGQHVESAAGDEARVDVVVSEGREGLDRKSVV